MQTLSQQHCLHHFTREAAARCPECKQFFCRECIAEHDDRVICAGCLRKLHQPVQERKYSFAFVGSLIFCFIGIFTAWLFFYWVGEILISIPAEVHEGTVWQSDFLDE